MDGLKKVHFLKAHWAAWVCAYPAACAMAQTSPPTVTNYPTVRIQDTAIEFRQFDKVEITGSSIVRKEQIQALPVQVISRQDIQRRGSVSLTEVVQGLTSVFNGLDLSQIGLNKGAMDTAALRGMPNGTLVLLNGKRLAPYGIQTISGKERSSVDLGLIPLSAVERIEVLTDGASTLYGTDAIAGVINIITRSEFDGVELGVTHSRPRSGVAQGAVLSLNWGRGQLARDGFSFRLSAEVDQYDALRTADRPNASQARIGFEHAGRSFEADSPKLVAFTSPAWLYSPSTPQKTYSALYANGQCTGGSLSYRGFPGGCRQNLLPTFDIYPDKNSQRFHFLGEKRLNPTTTLFAELLYGKQAVQSGINEWWTISGRLDNAPNSVGHAEAIANGFRLDYTFYFWQPNLQALRQSFDKSQMRAVVGVRGEWSQWDYQANIYQSKSQVTHSQELGSYNNLGIANTGPSSPLRDARLLMPLDSNNTLTNQLLAERVWQHQATGQTASTATEFRASRPLFEIQGKDAMFGWGVEMRQEGTESNVNPNLAASTFPQPSFEGKRRNTAAYAELQIPVRPNWDVIAALRSDHYTDVGATHNGKLATRWAANSQWALRGSIGTGFRAPSIGQMQVLNQPFRNSSFTLSECTPAMLTRTSQLVASTGFPVVCPANGSANIFTNGNSDLRPEKSTQATLGLAFTPSRNLSMSADYWRVDMRDTLQFESLSAVLADPTQFSSAYMVNPTVLTRNFGAESFHHLGFFLRMQNLGASVKEGVDLDVRYRIPTQWGRFMVGAQATHMITSKEKISPNAQWSSDLAAYSQITDVVTPRLSARLLFNWELAHMNWQLNANYNSAYRDRNISAFTADTGRAETVSGRRVGSYLTWDLFGHYQITKATRLRLGIANLMDRQPPLSFYSPTAAVWGVNTQNGSLFGRTIQMGMTHRF